MVSQPVPADGAMTSRLEALMRALEGRAGAGGQADGGDVTSRTAQELAQLRQVTQALTVRCSGVAVGDLAVWLCGLCCTCVGACVSFLSL